MCEGFKHLQLQTSEPQVTIHLCDGGTGPGLLLLHGNPLTHVTWQDGAATGTALHRGGERPARLR